MEIYGQPFAHLFLTPICIILPPRSFLQLCAFERLQSSISWEVAVLNRVRLLQVPPTPWLSVSVLVVWAVVCQPQPLASMLQDTGSLSPNLLTLALWLALCWPGPTLQRGWGGLAQGLGIYLFAFGGAYWPTGGGGS